MLKRVLQSIATASVVLSITVADVEAKKPNIVVILADDLGYGDLGFTGSKDIPTPNIDKLAKGGVTFKNGYSSHSFCAPTRAGLVTGRYQARIGFETNPAFDLNNEFSGLDEKETTIADRLKKVGYKSAIVGKWHLGTSHKQHPLNRGFDYFYGHLDGGHDYFKVDTTVPAHHGYHQPLSDNKVADNVHKYLTHQLTDKAIDFIDANKNNPFYLLMSYNAPHTPLQAPQKTIDMFKHVKGGINRQIYCAMVYEMDQAIGNLMNSLEKNGLSKDTVVFFLSDNGGPNAKWGSGTFTDNGPYRGYKGALYEGGVHVPFTAYWPGTLPAGAVYDKPVISFDTSYVAVDLAGGDLTGMDGKNILSYVTDPAKGTPHEYLYFRRRNGVVHSILRHDMIKMIKPHWEGQNFELYDLNADKGEKQNLASQRPELIKEMRKKWDMWNKSNIDFNFPDYHHYNKEMLKIYKGLNPNL